MPTKLIGLLAGMGVKSTAPFVDLVIQQCEIQYGARYEMDFPPMMIYSLPIPYYLDRPVDHLALKETILEGLRKLEATGVDFIAMPCNTAHVYFEELRAGIGVPLVNMVDEAARRLPRGVTQVALLATRVTAGAGLYQQRFETTGVEVVTSDRLQDGVDELLGAIKSPQGRGPAAQELWDGLMAEAESEGLLTVLIACTDLNVVDTRGGGVAVVDATQALASAVVERWRQSS